MKTALAPLRRGLPLGEPRERPPSPREAARWIITNPDRHGPQTAERLRRLLEHCPELHRTHKPVRQFATMLDARDAAPLSDWLDGLVASGLPPLAGIAKGLREDRHAVIQGIVTPYNSGVNEGRITDVKLQKRSWLAGKPCAAKGLALRGQASAGEQGQAVEH
ncbi:transposase [Streptomyces sp. NPDC048483]|uniref:transposase n=1 Tax=Streptomyces sp. NPDC048483 TaxID=3154927 RepID=UPI003446F2F7